MLEHPPLVAGEAARVVMHITELSGFRPVAGASVSLTLTDAADAVERFTAEPSQPGIYAVEVTPRGAGLSRMAVRIQAGEMDDVHEAGIVTVHTAGSHPSSETGAAEDSIAFSKEQQWALDFGVAAAEQRAVQGGLTVPADVHARTGGDATLTAPVPGRIDPSGEVPHPGARVRAGQVLAHILPRSDDLRDAAALRADVVALEQERGLAQREKERAERLVDARAVPARRLDQARADLASAEAGLEAARARWDRYRLLSDPQASDPDGGYTIRAPFDGVVIEVSFAAGESVEQGQPLLQLIDPDEVHLVGLVPESSAQGLDNLTGGELIVRGQQPRRLGTPLVVGPVIDPGGRTTEVCFSFDNREAGLALGSRVEVRLFRGDPVEATTIPESALIDDAGVPVAYVQVGGESFERRMLRLGDRADGFVQVLEGLEPGERVVDRGAYLVRLASAADAAPSHGHVH
ncbi:hypothetical protein ABI59_17195 [Acidobacteria bacterium Mor1]|nr:hypothetical protein ABI59_17195 [Acidobacteria bacterium Mor1]